MLEAVLGQQVVGLGGEGHVSRLARGRARAAHEHVVLLDQGPGEVRGQDDVALDHLA